MAGARSTWGLYRVDLGRGQLVSAWRGTLRTVPWHRLLPGPGHPLLLPIVQGWGRGCGSWVRMAVYGTEATAISPLGPLMLWG